MEMQGAQKQILRDCFAFTLLKAPCAPARAAEGVGWAPLCSRGCCDVLLT